jgi:hypothetical protein
VASRLGPRAGHAEARQDVRIELVEQVLVGPAHSLKRARRRSYRGPDGMIEFLGRITAQVHSVVEVEEMVEAGEYVVVIGRSAGPPTPRTSRSMCVRFMSGDCVTANR